MGAKLVKSKSLPISEKVNGQENQVITLNCDTQNNGTTTLEKKTKKKKGKLSNQKSWDVKVDKFTSTEGTTDSTAYIKKLVNGSSSQRLSYETRTSLSNQSGTPSKDVLELRDACIRRGIISPEMSIVVTPAPIEQEHPIEESTNETTIVVTNAEEEIPIE